MRPAAGEIDLALEVLDAIDLRRFWRGEAAGSHDVIAAGYGRAIVGRKLPAFRGLIPNSRSHLGAKADISPEIIAFGHEAEVAQDLRLGGVFLRPFPRALQLRIEGVAVVDGLNVATRAGIAVPVPGAADIASLFQYHRGEACLAQPMQEIQAGKAGTDNNHVDVDLLRRTATGFSRRRCCDRCVWHATPPVYFYFRFVVAYRCTSGLSSNNSISGSLRLHTAIILRSPGRRITPSAHPPRYQVRGNGHH